MKIKQIIFLFILTQVSLVFLHIKKHMDYMQQTFIKQKNELIIDDLNQKKQTKKNQLFALKNNKEIQSFAEHSLHMKQIKLHNIKTLSPHDKHI